MHLLIKWKDCGWSAARKLDFKIARYAIILLAAATLENFRSQTLTIADSPFFNLYRLEKVAENLHLDYDRTKQAKKIYEELEKKGEIRKETTAENKTYISLTEKGEKICLKKLEELYDLKDYLIRTPSLQDKYTEGYELQQNEWSKDVVSKSQGFTDVEIKAEEMITRISSWN